MAEATLVSGTTVKRGRSGRQRMESAHLAAPTTGDTWTTSLKVIDHFTLTFAEAAAASDSVAGTVSGGVITLTIVGTGRKMDVRAWGV